MKNREYAIVIIVLLHQDSHGVLLGPTAYNNAKVSRNGEDRHAGNQHSALGGSVGCSGW